MRTERSGIPKWCPVILLGHSGILGGVTLFWLLAAIPATGSAPPTAAEALRAHCAAREATVTLRAQFVQVKVFEELGEEDRSSGVLYYRKPDAVRWQYSEPDTSWTVLQGDKGWSVFPRIRQVQRFDLQRSQTDAVLSIVGFGACGQDLQRAFEIDLAAEDDGLQVLVMTPREPEMAARFDRIDLALDPKDSLPRRVVLHERSGNTVRFEFSGLERGARIEDKLFEYEVPRGYEVVE